MNSIHAQFLRAAAASMGSQSSRQIRAHITAERPGDPVTVEVPKPNLQRTRETMAVAKITRLLELVTGSGANPIPRIRAVAGQGAAFMAGIIGNGRTPENSDEISRLTDALLLLFNEHDRDGLPWPIPADFGQPYAVVTQPGPPAPSLWASQFPDDPPPSEDEIDTAITTPEP